MSQFELSFGGGEVAAFIDLADMTVRVYAPSTAEAVHQKFGGRQYYTSRSTLSGAGWIPASPTLRRVATLRVDNSRPRFPRGGEIMPGIRLIVPTTGRNWASSWHGFLVVRDEGPDGKPEVFETSDWELQELLPRLLRGEAVEGGRPFTLRWMTEGNGWSRDFLSEAQLTVQAHGLHEPLGKLSRRRMLELLFYERLEWGLVVDPSAWQAQLGLATGTDGLVYHAAGGLLRRKAQVDRDTLQEECPWAFFLADSLDFIVQRGGEFLLVRHDAGEGEASRAIDAVDALVAYQTGQLPVRPGTPDWAGMSSEEIEEAMMADHE